ncbi:hypothetical protein LZC95_50475 [Pendulispora brunnea]|uniref:Uncharacterized protein n=1 Tax=Pendulispora brunnea TaxID=2905690 RepID=A0ABZ2K7G9_9BACT
MTSVRRFVLVAAISGLAALGAGTLTACEGGSGPNSAKVTPGEMPAGESWTGVYYHPVYGYLHLVETDSSVVGRWKRTDQSKWGELSGTKSGNVLHFTWKEHTYGMVGPSAQAKGRGVFVYKMNSDNTAILQGQYGNDDNETGSQWDNVKQARMQPDLKSIGGTAPEEAVRPGGLE